MVPGVVSFFQRASPSSSARVEVQPAGRCGGVGKVKASESLGEGTRPKMKILLTSSAFVNNRAR